MKYARTKRRIIDSFFRQPPYSRTRVDLPISKLPPSCNRRHCGLEHPRVESPDVRVHYDEFRDASSKIRPHYEQVITDLKRRDTSGVKRLSDTARRLLAERGVTFNIYDAKGLDTPWHDGPGAVCHCGT